MHEWRRGGAGEAEGVGDGAAWIREGRGEFGSMEQGGPG